MENKIIKQKRKINKKRILSLLLILLILVVLSVFLYSNINKKEKNNNDNNGGNVTENQDNYTKILEDTTKVNISEKIKEEKKISNLVISDIKIEEVDNVSKFTANVKNNGNYEIKDLILSIKLVNSKNEEITTISGYVGNINPGEVLKLDTQATFDFSNAYDVQITIKDSKN